MQLRVKSRKYMHGFLSVSNDKKHFSKSRKSRNRVKLIQYFRSRSYYICVDKKHLSFLQCSGEPKVVILGSNIIPILHSAEIHPMKYHFYFNFGFILQTFQWKATIFQENLLGYNG